MNHMALIIIGLITAIMLARIFLGFPILAVGVIIGALFFTGILNDIPHSIGVIQTAQLSLAHEIGSSLAEQVKALRQGIIAQQNVKASPKPAQQKDGTVGSLYNGQRIVRNDG